MRLLPHYPFKPPDTGSAKPHKAEGMTSRLGTSLLAACEASRRVLPLQRLNPRGPPSPLGAPAAAPAGPEQEGTDRPSEAPCRAQHAWPAAPGAGDLLCLPDPPKWGFPMRSILSTQPVPPHRGENSFTARYNRTGPWLPS